MKKLLLNLLLMSSFIIFGSGLHELVKEGTVGEVQAFLDTHPEVDINNQATLGGKSALHCAVRYGNVKVIKLLLDSGAYIDAITNCCETPLFFAVECENEKIVKLLLDSGANVCAINSLNKTPLFLAVEKEKLEIIKLLLHYKSNINVVDIAGMTPLSTAVRGGDLNSTRLLLAFKANVNFNDGLALSCAIDNIDQKMINLLIEYGAEVSDKDREILKHYHLIDKDYQLCLKQNSTRNVCSLHALKNAQILERFFAEGEAGRLKYKDNFTSVEIYNHFLKYYNSLAGEENYFSEEVLSSAISHSEKAKELAKLFMQINHDQGIDSKILIIPSKYEVEAYLAREDNNILSKVIVIGGHHWFVVGLERVRGRVKLTIIDSYFSDKFNARGDYLKQLIGWFNVELLPEEATTKKSVKIEDFIGVSSSEESDFGNEDIACAEA